MSPSEASGKVQDLIDLERENREGWANAAHWRTQADHFRQRAAEMETQRDDYLNREWVAVKAKQAAERRCEELEGLLSEAVSASGADFWACLGLQDRIDAALAARQASAKGGAE